MTEAVELTRAVIGDALRGRQLAIDELGAEVADRITGTLPRKQRGVWERECPCTPRQPLGEAVVHFCLRILALRSMVCFAPGRVIGGCRVADLPAATMARPVAAAAKRPAPRLDLTPENPRAFAEPKMRRMPSKRQNLVRSMSTEGPQ